MNKVAHLSAAGLKLEYCLKTGPKLCQHNQDVKGSTRASINKREPRYVFILYVEFHSTHCLSRSIFPPESSSNHALPDDAQVQAQPKCRNLQAQAMSTRPRHFSASKRLAYGQANRMINQQILLMPSGILRRCISTPEAYLRCGVDNYFAAQLGTYHYTTAKSTMKMQAVKEQNLIQNKSRFSMGTLRSTRNEILDSFDFLPALTDAPRFCNRISPST